MGLGASSQPVVERWNGITYEKPYARTRDVLRFVKRALDGEKIDEVFETFEVHGFKLSRPVIVRPPILLGALRPGMLRLAGREADGAILNWLGGERRRAVSRRSRRVGKMIAARLFVVPTADADIARMIGRRMISSYLTVNAYAEFHRWLGRERERSARCGTPWAAGDRKLRERGDPRLGRRRADHPRLLRGVPRARLALHRGRRRDPDDRHRALRRRPHRGRQGLAPR